MPSYALVTAPVTVLWRSSDSPRTIDAFALADEPDHSGWLAAMDESEQRADSRFGLEGLVESELVRGEPVIVLDQRGPWSAVVAPWQPSSKDSRGYPGYVRTAHLAQVDSLPDAPRYGEPTPVARVVDDAREFIGLPYLWGGVSPAGLDCSGVVHLVCRRYGILVPRDAHDQRAACRPVGLGSERLGDLYFFAHPGKEIHHVGFATGDRRMLHAPGTGQAMVEESMPSKRLETLVSVGRLPDLAE